MRLVGDDGKVTRVGDLIRQLGRYAGEVGCRVEVSFVPLESQGPYRDPDSDRDGYDWDRKGA